MSGGEAARRAQPAAGARMEVDAEAAPSVPSGQAAAPVAPPGAPVVAPPPGDGPLGEAAAAGAAAGAEAAAAERAERLARAQALKEEGNAKYKAGDYGGAQACYVSASEADPSNADYLNNCAAAELAMGAVRAALKSCDRCLALEPGNLKALMRKGKAHQRLGEAAEAVGCFRDVLIVDPSNSAALAEKKDAELLLQRIKRARENLAAGDTAQALALAQAALRQAPDSRELNLMRVRGLLAAGDADQAFSLTTKLMRDNQNDAGLLACRAKCLYLQENFASALRHLQQALALDPDNKDAQTDIRMIRKLDRLKEDGNNLFKAGKNSEAFEAYSQCLEVDPSNKLFNAKLYCNRAAASQKLGQHQAALADCDKALELNPEYGKAYMRRAACLRQLGGKSNLEQALGAYTEAERVLGRSEELAQAVRETKAELKKAKRKDYYGILDLPNRENSSEGDIKKAYKRAALKWHPDRHASATEEDRAKAEAMFKDVGEAYEVLSDEKKRQQYDQGYTLEEIEQGGPMGGGHHDPNEIFQMFFGGGMGGMGGGFGGGHFGGGHHGHSHRGGGHHRHSHGGFDD
jgi:DnaJ family protein C protein 7